MKKQLIVLAISVLFLFPGLTYAASIDEQRQAILIQLIHLIEQQIIELQAQLAAQTVTGTGTSVEATSTPVEVSPFTPGTWTCVWNRDGAGHQHKTCGG